VANSFWRATCIQMRSNPAWKAQDQEAAWAIIDGNIDRALALIDQSCAQSERPALVVVPEFAFQGPPLSTPVSDWIERACTTIPGPITDRLSDAARRNFVYIAANHFEFDEHWPGHCFNTSFVLDPRGEVILRYRRTNTASWTSPHDIMESYVEVHGMDAIFPVVDTELGRLAVFPCGEIVVPEIARMFMLRGAEVLLHPTNEPITAHGEAAKICRAAENMCYLVSANVAGAIGFSSDGSVTGGHSQIVDHLGNRIAHDPSADEGIGVTATVDLAALRAARRSTGMGNPLMRARWELYRESYNEAEAYPANGLAGRTFESIADLQPLAERALDNLERSEVLRRPLA